MIGISSRFAINDKHPLNLHRQTIIAMKLLVLQHVAFEGPAVICTWAEQKKQPLTRLFCAQESHFPTLDSFDALIIMGGPMSVNDDLDWINSELNFISQSIEANKPVLGICLGAQLIAKALGAPVTKNAVKEIGWFDVTRTALAPPKHWAHGVLPETFHPLHWHGDTFAIPQGATQCFRSANCENQAFYYGDNVLGLQFHIEFDHATASRVAEECGEELNHGGEFVQSRAEILNADAHFIKANALIFKLMEAMKSAFDAAN